MRLTTFLTDGEVQHNPDGSVKRDAMGRALVDPNGSVGGPAVMNGNDIATGEIEIDDGLRLCSRATSRSGL